MLSPTYQPNIGLLDARGTAQVLHTLSATFKAVEFADWCTISEEIVLRDYILLVGKFDKLPRHLKLALRPYVAAGIFRPLREAFSIPELPSDIAQLKATLTAISQGLTATTAEDATFEARRVLGAEAHTGIAATPLLRQMQHFGLVRRPGIETMIWDLAAQYRSLSDALLDVRTRFQRLADLPTISIPPIALLGVSRCKHFDELHAETMQLRDEFAPLRRKMRELQEQLTRGDLTPGDAVKIEKLWRDRWQSVADSSGASCTMAMARTSGPLLVDGCKIVTSASKGDVFSTLQALTNLVGHGFAAVGSMQLRPVHRSVSNYMRTKDQDIKRAVARLFQYDFVQLDSDMNSLAMQPGNPWRLAMQKSQYTHAIPSQSALTPRQVIGDTQSPVGAKQDLHHGTSSPLAKRT